MPKGGRASGGLSTSRAISVLRSGEAIKADTPGGVVNIRPVDFFRDTRGIGPSYVLFDVIPEGRQRRVGQLVGRLELENYLMQADVRPRRG